jgi:hypothetical protein
MTFKNAKTITQKWFVDMVRLNQRKEKIKEVVTGIDKKLQKFRKNKFYL